MNKFDIYPGIGIGPIRLGMTPDDVRTVFTEREQYEDWMGGNLNDAVLFHGLRLHFSEYGPSSPPHTAVLEEIFVHQREDAYLFGQPMTAWTKQDILNTLLNKGYVIRHLATGEIEMSGLSIDFDDDGSVSVVLIDNA